MWYLILFIIIVLCLVVILWLAGRKIKKVKFVNPSPSPQEKQADVKKRLIESKLEKCLIKLGQKFLNFIKTSAIIIQKKTKRLFPKGVAQEKKVKRGPQASLIESKLLEAQVLMKKRNMDEAEEKYIEVLQLNSKNVEAYMALGDIYTLRKDWQTAQEAYRHIIKIKPGFFNGYKKLANVWQSAKKWQELKKLCEEVLTLGHEQAWVYVKLGTAYKKTGYPEKAEEHFKKAVELEPNNEALLDYLLEVAIINKNKDLAQKAFNTLSSLSKDEMKIQSYRDKIDIL